MIISKQEISTEDIARHYNDLDEIYRKYWGESLHHGLWLSKRDSPQVAIANLTERVIERLRIQSGAKVCDIGCGYGAVSRVIAERFAANVTGFTLSAAQAERASLDKPKRGQVTLHVEDWIENELPAKSFDHAFSIESSEHMRDKTKFFEQAHRVLISGGSFVVCAWLAKERAKTLETALFLKPICADGKLPSLGTRSDYVNMMKKAGFVIERFEDVTARVSRTWSVCSYRLVSALPTDRSALRLIFRRADPQFGFFLLLFRIRLAYALGAMRYGIFTARASPRHEA